MRRRSRASAPFSYEGGNVARVAPVRVRRLHAAVLKAQQRRVAQHDDVSDTEPDRERLARAVEAYRRALEVDPDHYWSRFQMGRCYVALADRTAPETC